MSARKPEEWSTGFYLIERWGLPLVALFVICGAMYQAAVWIAPKLDKAFDMHVQVIPEIAETQKRQVELAERQAQSTEAMSETFQATTSKIDEIHRAVVKPKEIAKGRE